MIVIASAEKCIWETDDEEYHQVSLRCDGMIGVVWCALEKAATYGSNDSIQWKMSRIFYRNCMKQRSSWFSWKACLVDCAENTIGPFCPRWNRVNAKHSWATAVKSTRRCFILRLLAAQQLIVVHSDKPWQCSRSPLHLRVSVQAHAQTLTCAHKKPQTRCALSRAERATSGPVDGWSERGREGEREWEREERRTNARRGQERETLSSLAVQLLSLCASVLFFIQFQHNFIKRLLPLKKEKKLDNFQHPPWCAASHHDSSRICETPVITSTLFSTKIQGCTW